MMVQTPEAEPAEGILHLVDLFSEIYRRLSSLFRMEPVLSEQQ